MFWKSRSNPKNDTTTAEDLPRAKNMAACFDAMLLQHSDEFNYVEIGTSFKEDEGLSTLVAAQFLEENQLNGRVFSHEMLPQHILASQQIIDKHNHGLRDRVNWIEGNSIFTLPNTLKQIPHVSFGFIDGSGHPLFNMFEFEQLWQKLERNGLILVDDCVPLAPSDAYSGRRDFGKAQIILPFLLLIEFLNFQKGVVAENHGLDFGSPTVLQETLEIPAMSNFVRALYQSDDVHSASRELLDMDFEFLPANQIVIGRKDIIQRVRDRIERVPVPVPGSLNT